MKKRIVEREDWGITLLLLVAAIVVAGPAIFSHQATGLSGALGGVLAVSMIRMALKNY